METDVLEPLIGRWEIPAGDGEPGEAMFAWALGRRFVEMRTSVPVEGAPDGLMIIAPAAGGGFTQHYFDSRGVVRVYAMRFDGPEWTLERRTADFSPLDFHQRFEGTLSEDGSRIDGRWLISHDDGATFEVDFPLSYVRA